MRICARRGFGGENRALPARGREGSRRRRSASEDPAGPLRGEDGYPAGELSRVRGGMDAVNTYAGRDGMKGPPDGFFRRNRSAGFPGADRKRGRARRAAEKDAVFSSAVNAERVVLVEGTRFDYDTCEFPEGCRVSPAKPSI